MVSFFIRGLNKIKGILIDACNSLKILSNGRRFLCLEGILNVICLIPREI